MLSQMEYRGAYLLRTLGKISTFGSQYVVLAIMVNRFDGLGGWSAYEVLFMYAIGSLSFAVAGTFATPINDIAPQIRSGEFDGMLVRPVNTMWLALCQKASAGYVANYIMGVGVMVYAGSRLNINVTVLGIITLIITIMGGVLIHMAVLIISGAVHFWLVQGSALSRILLGDIKIFSNYPIHIFPALIQITLTVALPYAFISYYPAALFFNRTGETIFHPFVFYLSPLAGIICFGIAYLIWQKGINAYQSTGS